MYIYIYLCIQDGPRADRYKWSYGAPLNVFKMGNSGYNLYKWSYFTLLIAGRGPSCTYIHTYWHG